jgi:hypothetical protein
VLTALLHSDSQEVAVMVFMSVNMNSVDTAQQAESSTQEAQCGMERQMVSDEADTAHVYDAMQAEQGLKRQMVSDEADTAHVYDAMQAEQGLKRQRDSEDAEQEGDAITNTSTTNVSFAIQVKDEFTTPKVLIFKSAFISVYRDRLQGLEAIGGSHVIPNDRPLQLVHTICLAQVRSVHPEYVIYHKAVCALLLQVCLEKCNKSQEGEDVRQAITHTIDMWKSECSSVQFPVTDPNLKGTAALIVRERYAGGKRALSSESAKVFASLNVTLRRAGVTREKGACMCRDGTIAM